MSYQQIPVATQLRTWRQMPHPPKGYFPLDHWMDEWKVSHVSARHMLRMLLVLGKASVVSLRMESAHTTGRKRLYYCVKEVMKYDSQTRERLLGAVGKRKKTRRPVQDAGSGSETPATGGVFQAQEVSGK